MRKSAKTLRNTKEEYQMPNGKIFMARRLNAVNKSTLP